MRMFLLSTTAAFVATVTAVNASLQEKGDSAVSHNGLSAATENYRGWGSHRSPWWDRHWDDDDDDDAEDGGHGKWPHGDHGRGESSWKHGNDGDGSPYPPHGEEGGWSGHGRSEHGDVNGDEDGRWGHGREVNSPGGLPSERTFDGGEGDGRGYHGAHHGDDGWRDDKWRGDVSDGDGGGKRGHGNQYHGHEDHHGRVKHEDSGDRGRHDSPNKDKHPSNHGDQHGERVQGNRSPEQEDRQGREKHKYDGDRDDSPDGDKRPSKHYDDQDGLPQGRHYPNTGEKPLKMTPVAQQLRQDTGAFVSDALAWVNDLIGEDSASMLVIDTTFSLTKTEFAKLKRGPCGRTSLANVFPVLHKFVENPQDIGVLEDDVKQIMWTPSVACANNGEVEGAIYVSVQILCAEAMLLNISIASSGSTPTIQGQAAEDRSFYIDVDVLSGRIRATDAQGSIHGVQESRHYPANSADIHQEWAVSLTACGAARQLSIVGVVGGGWTSYSNATANGSGSATYQVAAVGYTESFGFSFSGENDFQPARTGLPAPTSAPEPKLARPSAVGDATNASSVAAAGAAAYVQAGALCRQSPGSANACAGRAVMSQLTSFYESVGAPTAYPSVNSAAHAPGPVVPVAVAGVVLVVALAAVAVVTVRRRRGYRPLVMGVAAQA